MYQVITRMISHSAILTKSAPMRMYGRASASFAHDPAVRARFTACRAFFWSGSNGNGRGGHGGGGSSSNGGFGNGNGDGGHRKSRWGMSFALSSAAQLMILAGSASAAKKEEKVKEPPKQEMTLDGAADALWALAGPMLTSLGFSGMCGLIAGAALKKVGQALAFVVGLVFLLVQGLAHTGAITVNWTHIHERVTDALDKNKDGKLDQEDFKSYMKDGLGVLAAGVPSVGGFLAGFVLGIKMF
mmetsp:Transcript_29178/g.64504  ORF Transcript_29178/g.64504 Transcript_29178/m.64504 type:complete len:243 (+) Transcript_29178:54-782(+)